MKIEGVVGPTVITDGALAQVRLGRAGEQIVTELHGKYYEQNARGNIFFASNAASTSSAGLNATYTGGLCLSNPAGSNKVLVPVRVSIACTVITVGVTTAGLIAGWASTGVTAHTTALVPSSTAIGNQLPAVGKADQAATLVGTPAWFATGVAATAQAAGSFAAHIEMDGAVIILPGGYLATGTSIASPASAMLCSMSWVEVPI